MIRKRGKTVAKLLRELKGVGEKTEKLFQKIGITTTDDLLHYYPRNYDSYEAPEEIGSLKENSVCLLYTSVVAVIVENGGSGSEAAVPIAGQIFDAYYAN